MDLTKVNWFAFFPPLFSIYLLFISGILGGYLNSQVRHVAERKKLKPDDEDFIRNLASGWAAQVGFISAILASFFSTTSVWSASRSFEGVTATLAVLLLIFALMLLFVLSYEPDQIVAVRLKFGPFKITPSNICKGVLLVVNLILIIGNAWSQQLTTTRSGP